METLEYGDISAENKGHMSSGRLKMTDQSIIFKNNKTGKVDQLNSNDIDLVNFQRFVDTFGLRVFTKNGQLHRFVGFKSGDETKLAEFFKKNYSIDMLEKELSLRGWNWGTAHFKGAVLSFDCDKKTSFEIPLQNVSQCTPGKNEVTLEFHQNDDTPVSLVEMRFHIPSNESTDIEPVDAFYQNVVKQASVLSVSGDAIAIFREIQCLTPRGRYDVKMFQSFFQLHGKTFDYKIPMSTVLRLFLLPHRDNRQTFFILSLDPPIKQGQTRYHYLIFLFGNDEDTSIELPFSKEELKEKYDGKLEKEMSGPVYEVIGKIMKALLNRKLTGAGSFKGHSGTPAIACSYKATAGYLYPLERGFVYVHKPPMHIRFEEISSVNFARGGGTTRSFDFEIDLKSSAKHTFASIEKEEYTSLFNYISSKKIQIKNTGKNDKNAYNEDDFGDSDNEAEPDAYLARVKAEGQERESDDDGGDSDESTDDDFNPDAERVEDVADEYDSNVATTSDSDADSDDSGREKKKKKKEKKKDKSGSSKSKKKNKDDDRPKRATTAYMVWFNETRDQIRKDNPGLKITDVSKKAGEMWREMKDKSIWEEKAAKDKERYANEMKNYKPGNSGSADDSGSKKRKKEASPKKTATTMAGGGFKSKEYISDDESSGSDEDKKKKKKKKKSESENKEKEEDENESSGSDEDKKKKKKKKKSESENEEEEEDEVASEESGSD